MPRFGESLNKKIHDNLLRLLGSRQGREISRAELRNLYQEKYPNENVDWVQATDHCINRTNKGACECAKTDAAIFQWMEKGLYKIR
jgi:hypothetical protein